MNSVGHIDNFTFPYKQNKSEIKKIAKCETDFAFGDYMRRQNKICSCFSINENDLKEYKTFEEMVKETGASTRCASCLKDLKNYFKKK